MLTQLCKYINNIALDNTTEEHGPTEFAVYPPMPNTLSDLPRQPNQDEMVVYKVQQNTAIAEVVKRDDTLLTPT